MTCTLDNVLPSPPGAVARYLDHAVYLMHYLPDDFPEREIKNTCYALKGLKEKLLEGHYKKKGTPFVQLDC